MGYRGYRLMALGRVTSAMYMYNFTADFSTSYWQATKCKLSISSKGHLLVSPPVTGELRIYTTSGRHVTTLDVPDTMYVYDAVWTRQSNIVCTTGDGVIVVSKTRSILNKADVGKEGYLSVSQNGDIYISHTTSVYESTDDGKTWSIIFSVLDSSSYIQQAIKVSTDHYSDIFWTFESFESNNMPADVTQLGIYTLNKTAGNADRNVTWSSVAMPSHLHANVSVYFLAFDGHSTVFALAYHIDDVLMWSVNGTFYGQLQLGVLFSNLPNVAYSLAVESSNHTMYVGKETHGRVDVNVFALLYELP